MKIETQFLTIEHLFKRREIFAEHNVCRASILVNS